MKGRPADLSLPRLRGVFALLGLCLFVGFPNHAASGAEKDAQQKSGREVALADAIRHFADGASLDLVYADELLAGIKVDLRLMDDAGGETLDRILVGTDIAYKINQQQRLVLYRDEAMATRDISGYVITARGGGAVVDARVSLTKTQRLTRTDATGAFTLRGVPKGFETITITANGLIEREMDLAALGSTSILVILSPTLELNENLRVFAPKRTRLTISPLNGKLSLTSNESFQEGPPGWDLFDSLKELPGVNAGTGEPGLEFRGSQPSENLVLLDGIQLFQFDHALGSFSALNADAIGEIEVFKGGYPANYGDRLSGVLALSTRDDVFDTREIRAGIDRDKLDLTFQSPLGDKFAVLISGRSSIGEDISNTAYERRFESTFNDDQPLAREEQGVNNFREIAFSDFIGKVAWRPSMVDKVNLTLFSGRDDVQEGVALDLLNANTYNKTGELTNRGVSLNWGRVWNAEFDTELTVSNSLYESTFLTRQLDWDEFTRRYEQRNGIPLPPYGYLENHKANFLEDVTVQLEAGWLVHPRHQLKFGLSSSEKVVSQEETTWYSGFDEFRQQTELKSWFVQDHWEVNDWFSSVVGVRVVENDLSKTQFVEPRLSFQINPTKTLRLRGSFGQYHQHLLRSPDNLNYFYGIETWFLAFDQLEPGRSQHIQIGAGWQHNDWSVDLELFRRKQRGALFRVFEPIAGDFTIHQSRDRIEGLDFLVRKHKGQFSAFLGYSYQDAKVLEDVTFNIPQYYPTDRNRPHQLNLALNYSRGLWRTVLAWRYTSGLPYSVPEIGFFTNEQGDIRRGLLPPLSTNDRRLPESHQLDARIQYSFGGKRLHGNIGLYLFNIYDRENPLYRYYTLEEDVLVPVDVPGFSFRPSLRLQIVY